LNTSGGLESPGHPVGASGFGIGSTSWQHSSGMRLALGENGGGNIAFEEVSMTIHILEKIK